MERSLSSVAMFPGQPDVGVRLAGSWRFLRYAVALVERRADRRRRAAPFRGDPNAAKDLIARVGADTDPAPRCASRAACRSCTARAFTRAPTRARAGTVWRDLNENGVVEPAS